MQKHCLHQPKGIKVNTEAFIKAYKESRNGASFFVRHPLVRSFIFSDGMKECAEAGCYWLLDVLATEIQANIFKQKQCTLCIAQVVVKDQKCQITGEFFEDDPTPYTKQIPYTDLPEGTWNFYLSYEDDKVICFLPSEY